MLEKPIPAHVSQLPVSGVGSRAVSSGGGSGLWAPFFVGQDHPWLHWVSGPSAAWDECLSDMNCLDLKASTLAFG